MSQGSSGSFFRNNGDANAGASGGTGRITGTAPVVVSGPPGSVYTGYTVWNTSDTLDLVGTITFAPGTVNVPPDNTFIVPSGSGVYSSTFDRDCVLSIALIAVDPAIVPGNSYLGADVHPAVAPGPAGLVFYADLTNR